MTAESNSREGVTAFSSLIWGHLIFLPDNFCRFIFILWSSVISLGLTVVFIIFCPFFLKFSLHNSEDMDFPPPFFYFLGNIFLPSFIFDWFHRRFIPFCFGNTRHAFVGSPLFVFHVWYLFSNPLSLHSLLSITLCDFLCVPSSLSAPCHCVLWLLGTHSSILAWKISWTEEPGKLQSMGLWRDKHDWAAEHAYSITFTSVFISFCLLLVWVLLIYVTRFSVASSLFFFLQKYFCLFIGLRWVFVVAQGILSWGMWDLGPWPGMNPGPLHWECGVLATGPPGSPALSLFLISWISSFIPHVSLCCI